MVEVVPLSCPVMEKTFFALNPLLIVNGTVVVSAPAGTDTFGAMEIFGSLAESCTVVLPGAGRLRLTTTVPFGPTIGRLTKASCTACPDIAWITLKDAGQPSSSSNSARPSPFTSAALVGRPSLSKRVTSDVGVDVPSPLP